MSHVSRHKRRNGGQRKLRPLTAGQAAEFLDQLHREDSGRSRKWNSEPPPPVSRQPPRSKKQKRDRAEAILRGKAMREQLMNPAISAADNAIVSWQAADGTVRQLTIEILKESP